MIVRRATLADRSAIADFLRRAYPERHRYKFPERWEWQFVNNPFRNSERLPLWIAFDGTRVIGQTGAMIEPMVIDGHETRVGWSVDTVVLPEYRGRGVGTRLQQANQDSHPLFMSLKMSPQNARIKSKLGGRPLPPLRLYRLRVGVGRGQIRARLARRSAALSRVARSLSLDAGLEAACRAGLAAGRSLRRKRNASSPSGVRMEEVPGFGTEADTLWQEIGLRYKMLIRRDACYLNWKFVNQPFADIRRFLAVRSGRTVGYVIVRKSAPPEPNVGVILDLFADPNDEPLLAGMTAFAIRFLRDAGVDVIQAAASTGPYDRAYRAWGFRKYREVTPICYVNSTERAWPSSPAEVAPADLQGNWDNPDRFRSSFFGCGDHDLDQYPLAKL
jgi:GNAT superfamily N-acetyltransferase